MLSLLLCLVGTSASTRSHQAVEWNANAANTITTVFTVSGTQARWLVLDCGSHEYNWKAIITRIILGEAYASPFEGDTDLVVGEIVKLQEKQIAGHDETGPWTVEVTWTGNAAASKKGFWATYNERVRYQNLETLTKWVVQNIPLEWYNMKTKNRIYMTSNSEFAITAVGFTEVTTRLRVSGTKAKQILLSSGSHEFNGKAIITRIIDGENYVVTNGFPVDLKKGHEIDNMIYLTWTASATIQKKYFHELKNMQTNLEKLSNWVIQRIPYEWWNVETKGPLFMTNESEFKIELVA